MDGLEVSIFVLLSLKVWSTEMWMVWKSLVLFHYSKEKVKQRFKVTKVSAHTF